MNIAIPSAKIDLGISDANQQWVITAYTLAFGSLLLLGGRIGDYMGRKKIFLIGLIGFAAASALGGIASTQGLLFASRALQGVFGALLAPAALAIISVTFTVPKERAKAFGVIGAISGGGAAIGLILGGTLTEFFSWRWCLGVNTPIAIIAAILAIKFVHESKAEGDNTYDIPGVITATAGLFSLTYGFNEAASKAFARCNRAQPWWFIPWITCSWCRTILNVLVPGTLPSGCSWLQPIAIRFCIPTIHLWNYYLRWNCIRTASKVWAKAIDGSRITRSKRRFTTFNPNYS